MRNILRNILILMLFVLCVFQAGTLWFDNFSITSVLSGFNEKEVNTTKTIDYVMNRIIVSLGDNKIVGKTNDIYSSNSKSVFDKAVAECVKNGNKYDMGEFSWNNILNTRAVIYEYSCVFDNKNIKYIFGDSIKDDKVNDISSFNYVIIMADSGGNSIITVFYNSDSGNYTARAVQNVDVASEIYSASSDFANGDVSTYISSEQSGFDVFSKNVFIPGWLENSIEYPAVDSLGIYKDESMVEKNAEDFFDNPAAKWRSDENNNLTFSDENTVVKYDKQTNVFEYSNYRADTPNDISFSVNYIAAVNTIRQDSFMENEYYLDSYEFNNGNYTFRFNYKINDRKLVQGNDIKNKTGMQSFIEINTEMGKVVKYRKYSYNYVKSSSNRIAERDFVTAIDKVYTDKKIDDIDLCYIASEDSIILNWIIDIDGEELVETAERE